MSDKRAREEVIDFLVEQLRNFDPDLFDVAAFVFIKDGKPVTHRFYSTNSRHGVDKQQRHIVESLQEMASQGRKNWGVL